MEPATQMKFVRGGKPPRKLVLVGLLEPKRPTPHVSKFGKGARLSYWVPFMWQGAIALGSVLGVIIRLQQL